MPSRFARIQTVLLATLMALVAITADAQELTFPTDPLGQPVTPDLNAGAGTVTGDSILSGAAPLGPDETLAGAPTSAYGSGMTYNPTLGAHLRARFNTRSYGQQQDNLDLGTMKLWELDGGVAFVDGQVTMNDDSGVGYNLGVGYRWLTLPMFPWSPDDEKIMGFSIWSDGQTVGQDNFFSQIGVGFELLGERLDFRANGYAPIGERHQTRDFAPVGESLTYTGNSVGQLLQGVRDTALTVGEAELASRVGNLDAWVFGSVYGFNGGGYDAVGGKVGLRGYATPDLLLSIAIANDDEFDTNALFSATWFIGRTRAENAPSGTLTDRFREPVLRNDYIASQQSVAFQAGEALLGADGEAIDIVHVDSTAAAGGDGTFENPLNSLDDIEANSDEGDIILAHGASDFDSQNAILQDDQIFFGEGNDIVLEVATSSVGTIELPETAAGAASGPNPTIDGGAGAGVTLANDNTVRNLTFDGGLNAIVTDPTDGSLNPIIQEVAVDGVTGDAMVFNTITRVDVDDDDDDDNDTEEIDVLDSVTISDTTFANVGGRDIVIDGDKTNAENADDNDGVFVTITDVTSTDNQGAASIAITNTTDSTGDSVTIDNYQYSGGVGGAIYLEETGSTVVVTNSEFTGGSGPAIEAQTTEGIINVGATNEITDITGDVIVVNANTGAITVDADIMTSTTVSGGGISITANEASVSAGGDMVINNDSIEILNAKADIDLGTASGGSVQDGTIEHTGTGDLFVITDDGTDADTETTSVAITVTADVTNGAGGGHSVLIDGDTSGTSTAPFNDTVLFSGTLTDNGQGVDIQNLGENALVSFGPRGGVEHHDLRRGHPRETTTRTPSSTSQELDIVTTSGGGLIASGDGELNITATGGNPTLPTSSITTDTGKAIDINGGSSSGGVRFGEVTTGVVSGDEAVEVVDFDGTVEIASGTIQSDGDAMRFVNTEFTLGDDDANTLMIVPGAGSAAVTAEFNDDLQTGRNLSITNVDAGGGDIEFLTSGDDVITTATLTDVVNGGELAWNTSAANASTLTVTDAAFADGFDFDATGDGALTVNMSEVDDSLTGGPINFTTSGGNNSSLNVTDLASTGAFNFTDGSTGTLDVNITDSTAGGDIVFASTDEGASSLDITASAPPRLATSSTRPATKARWLSR